MILRTWWQVFLVATAGGFVGEFMTLYEESRKNPTTERRLRHDSFYWIMACLMALAGGGIALMYGFKELNVLGALYLGGTAPVVLKSGFASFAPDAKPKIK